MLNPLRGTWESKFQGIKLKKFVKYYFTGKKYRQKGMKGTRYLQKD